MTIKVTDTFNTYLDWVKTTDSAYKSSFESLSEQVKGRLNNLLDATEIDAHGPMNPDNVWVNLLIIWTDEEFLVDNLKLLKKDEYLQLKENGSLDDYSDDKWDLIIDRLDDLGYIFLGYEKDEWTLLVN